GSAVALQADRAIVMTAPSLVVVPLAEPPSNNPLPSLTLPFAGPTSLGLAGDRVVVGGPEGLAIYPTVDVAPEVGRLDAVAITTKSDGTELYVLDAAGVIHVISPENGQETKTLTGGAPGTALAYAQGPNRLFAARAEGPALDAYDL